MQSLATKQRKSANINKRSVSINIHHSCFTLTNTAQQSSNSNSNSNVAKRLPVFCLINEDMWGLEYSPTHLMKPFRLRMQYDLANATHINSSLILVDARSATNDDLLVYHSPKLTKFLTNGPIRMKSFDDNIDKKENNDDSSNNNNNNNNNSSNSGNSNDNSNDNSNGNSSNDNSNSENKNIKDDEDDKFKRDYPRCYAMNSFALMSAGASLEAVQLLKDDKCNIAINFGGGLHHCGIDLPSGFCFVNDIVLAILSLRKLSSIEKYNSDCTCTII